MKRNNNRGQALVEFVLILPILIFMILSIVDIGRIMIMKNHLEGLIGDISVDTTSVKDKEYDVRVVRKSEGNDIVIELESCLDVTTPGLGKIIGDPCCVSTSRVFGGENEKN